MIRCGLKNLAVHFSGSTLDEIKSAELSEFETARRIDGVTPATIRRDLACLSGMFMSAIDWKWIDDGGNPVTSYMRRRDKRGVKEAAARTRYLSEEEEARLLARASEATRQAMILAIDTGLRRDELFSLTWPQIDQVRGRISTTKQTKTNRQRFAPLPRRSGTIAGTPAPASELPLRAAKRRHWPAHAGTKGDLLPALARIASPARGWLFGRWF